MPTQVQGQMGMDERIIEDADLEDALEAREEARLAAAPYRAAYREADTKAHGLIDAVVRVGEVVRIGRFRIERTATEARHVEFDAEAADRVTIKADSDA